MTAQRRIEPTPLTECRGALHHQTSPGFHGGSARLGWVSQKSLLSPSAVGSGRFGPVWSSAELDGAFVGGAQLPGRAYASLLYADDMHVHGTYEGAVVSALFTATTNGWAYAVSAFDAPCQSRTLAAGSILWRTRLVTPGIVPTLDGGMPLGTLSTPVLDLEASPPILYVTAMDAAAGTWTWKAFALDATSGAILPGWPVALDRPSIKRSTTTGPRFSTTTRATSRSAAPSRSAPRAIGFMSLSAGTGRRGRVDRRGRYARREGHGVLLGSPRHAHRLAGQPLPPRQRGHVGALRARRRRARPRLHDDRQHGPVVDHGSEHVG